MNIMKKLLFEVATEQGRSDFWRALHQELKRLRSMKNSMISDRPAYWIRVRRLNSLEDETTFQTFEEFRSIVSSYGFRARYVEVCFTIEDLRK